MSHYLLNFIVYTFTMLGIIFAAFIVAKKSFFPNNFSKNKNNFLSVESYLGLEPRKNLYVIKAGEERFLIASDPEKTSFLAKLDDNAVPIQNFENYINEIDIAPPVLDEKISPLRKILKTVNIVTSKERF